jgi:UDP-4-amino-4,6-dideoxy-N-acetyl-beta-L-altrosamine N-acetyltransferase
MITLKEATEDDCHTLFQWRNHPKVREYFFDDRLISYHEHKKWFHNSLQRDDRLIFVAHLDGKPVGVIRFDMVKPEMRVAEIDIYVAPQRQGQGLGKKILAEGEDWVRERTRVRSLVARVIEENQASVKMFKSCGFISKYVFLEKEIIRD